MALQVLLLKRDTDQNPQPETDLHPPAEDLLAHFHTTGSYDAVVLAVVPDGLTFVQRNRLPLDGAIFLVKDALEIPEPRLEGIVRW